MDGKTLRNFPSFLSPSLRDGYFCGRSHIKVTKNLLPLQDSPHLGGLGRGAPPRPSRRQAGEEETEPFLRSAGGERAKPAPREVSCRGRDPQDHCSDMQVSRCPCSCRRPFQVFQAQEEELGVQQRQRHPPPEEALPAAAEAKTRRRREARTGGHDGGEGGGKCIFLI